jgi:ABC-type Zn uptake system ZnuABC Zn-binding protein ZnuA
MKKKLLFLVCVGFVFSLSGCGKSDQEKQAESNKAIQKRTGGSIADIPVLNVTPDEVGKK